MAQGSPVEAPMIVVELVGAWLALGLIVAAIVGHAAAR